MGRYLRLAAFFYVEILQGDHFVWEYISRFPFLDTIINYHHHPPCARPLPRGQSIRYITLGFSILCTGRCALYVPLCNVSYFWPRDMMQMIPTTLSDLHLHGVIYDVSNVHLPFTMYLHFTWTQVYVFASYLLVCLYLHSKCIKCNAPLRGDISDCSLTQGSEKVRPWKKRDAFEDVILLKACRFFTLHDTCVLCHYCGWHVKCVLRPTAFKSPRFLLQTEHSAVVSKYGNRLVAWV